MKTDIAWKPYYSVGIPTLDSQHKVIVELIGDLYAAIEEGRDRETLAPTLDRLVKYANAHFRCEEQLLEQHDFPGLAVHRILHDRLRQRTADLKANMSLLTGPDLLRFLKEWWLEHIQGQDRQYSSFLKTPVHS